MLSRFLLWAAFSVGLLGSSFAQGPTPEQSMRRAMNNLAHEYVQCSAYFSVVAVAAENSGDNTLRDSYNAVGTTALENALMVGEDAGLLPEVHTARLELAVRDMAKRINNDTANISILFADYAGLCQAAMEDIGARLNHWVDVEIARQ